MGQHFHRTAVARPDCPDYHVLYDLAQEELKRGDMPLESLAFKVYLIKSVRVSHATTAFWHSVPWVMQLLDALCAMPPTASAAGTQVCRS